MNTSTSHLSWPADEDLLAGLHAWMQDRRWFPLKGDAAPTLDELSIHADVALDDTIRDLLISVKRPDALDEAPVLIHVPLALAPASDLGSFAVAGEIPGSHGFVMESTPEVAFIDGPHHPDFWRAWARLAHTQGLFLDDKGIAAIERRANSGRVMTGEQSNTNVVMRSGEGDPYADDIVIKLFRVLAAGRNPDVEVSVALAKDGWDRVRTPVAWSTLTWNDALTGETILTDSAVACTFIPAADDGFELFCDYATHDNQANGTVRSSAKALAFALGQTTAQMHSHMATSLGTSAPVPPSELAHSLRSRASWALAEVAFLAERIQNFEEKVDRVFARLEALDRLDEATRIHGDYHLGQVLHEKDLPEGVEPRWFVLDFEGEPLRPLAERSMPDQPMRDVAGMLRSFDYAAAVGKATDETWRTDMRTAFIDGYRDSFGDMNETEKERKRALIAALELDKALYEAVYEARNRPDWIDIPVRAIEALITED